ncbi:MAG: DNA-processing protein DprA [Parasphingorhabdus sp.]|uniref:DNA-processing protein DprA n=1 Tax=Parasphingorhabdus sp. TaxID=2709688 RepID=UPI003298777B
MNEDFNRLRLIRSSHIGPVRFRQLIDRYGSATKAVQALPDLAKTGGAKAPRLAAKDLITQEREQVDALGGGYLYRDGPGYPALLKELHNAPAAIIYKGDLSLLDSPAVAIVGARNASAAACRFARNLAHDLTAEGVTVISGLARGIDTAAHQGALKGGTVAVIAGGIDIYYPPENKDLQNDIGQSNLLIAEHPPGTEPTARHFPYRNRIIAGLARATIIVEAAPKSGSLITARLAAEAGRHVMAVPGSPLDPRSQGCNGLIREGAILVQTAEDILEQIRHFDDRAELAVVEEQSVAAHHSRSIPVSDSMSSISNAEGSAKERVENDDIRTELVNMLSMTPIKIDDLLRQSNIPISTAQMILVELELEGQLARHSGGRVSLPS